MTAADHSLIARVDARMETSRHESVELAVNMENIHFFEKDPPNRRIPTEKR